MYVQVLNRNLLWSAEEERYFHVPVGQAPTKMETATTTASTQQPEQEKEHEKEANQEEEAEEQEEEDEEEEEKKKKKKKKKKTRKKKTKTLGARGGTAPLPKKIPPIFGRKSPLTC